MKLSICCITYNHEKYIKQAIHSFLHQETSFEYEIIVSDDCSKDNTANIIKSLVDKFPQRITFIENSVNIGMIPNFKKALRACTGEYIALCEGDDFWTDENKLERQVNFLDKNTQFAGCFHNTEERYEEDDNKASHLYYELSEGRSISFTDLSYANLMPTCSVVFRNNLFGDFPKWFDDLKMGDWPLHILNAQYGDFWYMPRIMAVHRLHSQSVWMLQDQERNIRYTIDAYNLMIEGFSHKKPVQDQLILAKQKFLQPPPKPSIKRRVLNRLKKWVNN